MARYTPRDGHWKPRQLQTTNLAIRDAQDRVMIMEGPDAQLKGRMRRTGKWNGCVLLFLTIFLFFSPAIFLFFPNYLSCILFPGFL